MPVPALILAPKSTTKPVSELRLPKRVLIPSHEACNIRNLVWLKIYQNAFGDSLPLAKIDIYILVIYNSSSCACPVAVFVADSQFLPDFFTTIKYLPYFEY